MASSEATRIGPRKESIELGGEREGIRCAARRRPGAARDRLESDAPALLAAAHESGCDRGLADAVSVGTRIPASYLSVILFIAFEESEKLGSHFGYQDS
jgi:hypothetical protein